ncbi:LuxR C-terminal-related transcriptional regulator [Variovorax sp. J22R133]|uniref:helix-turn-helix transcriptional regulator n=1 Tax=Variovorax brevis TaxID=3053503 RepID=UPI0025780D66|nr:LuxR family transcriptional regulator [Variovorax sp. J22R133]MDM0118019.1 LuxR C-terminal-related transcriptional regulator [Variovorax sp. J22R133]
MESKQSSALLKIRQICCSGLPSRSFIPLVIGELREAIPSAYGQFTWSDERGGVTNHWASRFMPRRAAWIILHYQRYAIDAGITMKDLLLFGKPTGNLRGYGRPEFEATPTYAAIFEPYGFKWVLDGVVRDAMRPYGFFGLHRLRNDPDFSAVEEALMARVLPYVAHAMRVEVARPTRFVRGGGHSALVVCDGQGEVLEWSDEAHHLALFALMENLNLETQVERDELRDMRPALRHVALALRRRIEEGQPGTELPVLTRRNGWGEFEFRGYRLNDAQGPRERIGILIEQLVPLEAHLLERVNATALTMRQKEIALLSVKGLPNAEVARRLNITPNTLKDYFKDIYARLEINSHQQLVARLSSDRPTAIG